jgi:hypothetical protein
MVAISARSTLLHRRVENAGLGKKFGGQLLDPIPREAVLLAAPPKHASPEADRLEPESLQYRKIRWHCVVGEKAGYDLPQHYPWSGIGWCMRCRSSPLISWASPACGLA